MGNDKAKREKVLKAANRLLCRHDKEVVAKEAARWRPVLEKLVRWAGVICSACDEYSETCPYCATREVLTEAQKLLEEK